MEFFKTLQRFFGDESHAPTFVVKLMARDWWSCDVTSPGAPFNLRYRAETCGESAYLLLGVW
jgi:hypothetical protein